MKSLDQQENRIQLSLLLKINWIKHCTVIYVSSKKVLQLHSYLNKVNLYTALMVFFSSRGKFAVVRKCVEKCTGHEYAAKFMRKRRKGQDCRMEIIHEIAVLELATASLRVVNLHQVYEMASEMVLVLELWVSNLNTLNKQSGTWNMNNGHTVTKTSNVLKIVKRVRWKWKKNIRPNFNAPANISYFSIAPCLCTFVHTHTHTVVL